MKIFEITKKELLEEKWSKKYKGSIDCNNPKGFSQKAHCKGRLKEDAKSGTPEELFELLKLLPIDETAKELTNQIMSDLKDYYQNNGELPPIKTYAYQPEDKCIQPYELEVDFKQKKGAAVVGVGYAEQHYIQLYILQKDVEAAYFRVLSLPDKIFNIIKHECSHHYLSQKGIESCLYHTHPDGMKKYYYDRQEIVLHSREIFDELDKKVPNWRNEPLDKIRVYIADKVKDLRDNIYIYQPFPQSLRNKYVAFIMNNYIKPNHNSINENFGSDDIKLSDYNGITVELGRSKVLGIGKVQNIIVKYKGKPITGENNELGLGNMNVVIQSEDAFVGNIIIPTEFKEMGLAKHIYQATADLIGKPIVDSTTRGQSQSESGGYVWKNRDSFQPKTNKLDEKTDYSKEKEQGLHGWFARQGGKGKSKGWVDCNTCRDGKCKSCGRKEGESRSKYPACRPTPSACKTKGKGKSWGKKSKLNEDNQYLLPQEINEVLKGYIEAALWTEEERLNDEYGSEHNKVFKDYDNYEDKEDTELDKLIKLSANINNKGIEKFSKEDIEPDSLIKAYSDIKKFIQLAGDSVYEAIYENGLERLGTDIWFTRNGHGSGFFDHSYDYDDEKKLIQAGKSLGSVDLYINDNLKLSFSNQHLHEQSKQDIERELKLNEIKNTFKRLLK